MLILAHDCDPYGHLATGAKAIPDEQIARRCGCSVEEYQTLLSELERAGVFSRTSDGIIYSRRMTRDADRRAKDADRQQRRRGRKEDVPPRGRSHGSVTDLSRDCHDAVTPLSRRCHSASSSSSSSSGFGLTPPTPSEESAQSRREAAAVFGDDNGDCPHWVTAPGENDGPVHPIVQAVCEFHGVSPANIAARYMQQAWKALQDAVTEAEFLSELAKAKREGVKWHTFIKRLWNLKGDDKGSATKVKPNEAKYARFHK